MYFPDIRNLPRTGLYTHFLYNVYSLKISHNLLSGLTVHTSHETTR
ncbi:hypothetical protein HMPREF0307_01968 [Corynebacterium sp. DNF00584]|nr:hypothetical protein HMPREF0307_01968 [Corynebacterium sp. DNF00584]